MAAPPTPELAAATAAAAAWLVWLWARAVLKAEVMAPWSPAGPDLPIASVSEWEEG